MAVASNLTFQDSNGAVTNHPTSTAPTAGAPTTNWASATLANATDLSGSCTVTTSATAPAAGNVVTISFGTVFAKAPFVEVNGPLGAFATSVTNTGFTLAVAIAPAASTAYTCSYHVDP